MTHDMAKAPSGRVSRGAVGIALAGLALLAGCGAPAWSTATPSPPPTFGAAQAVAQTPPPSTGELTPGEQAYVATVTRLSGTVEQALNLTARTVNLTADDASLFYDATWRETLIVVLGGLQATAVELRGLAAPPRFADAQRELGYAATDLTGMARELAQWLDAARGYNLTAARTRQRAAQAALSRARQKLALASAPDYTPAPSATPRPALLNLTPARSKTPPP